MFFRSLLQTSVLLGLLSATTCAETACNNSPSLCNKAYNNITHLGAHDSPFVRDKSTSFSSSGTQYYNSTVQLDAGVRLLTAQVHQNSSSGADKWRLCHTSCDLLDAGNLESWLKDIKSWMDKNENEVVTLLLVNSDDATASDLGTQFNSSGIDEYAYKPATAGTAPKTWPTLDNLISNNTRLITFVASLKKTSDQYPYLMDEFTYVFENSYENSSPSNFSCTPNRPSGLSTSSTGNRMFLMNHFLYNTQLFGVEQPDEDRVNTTNSDSGSGSLGGSISNCTGVYSKAPNFVLVDFFNVGPAIKSVDAANGVKSATGRKDISTAKLTEGSSGSGDSEGAAAGRHASVFAVVVAVVVTVAFGL